MASILVTGGAGYVGSHACKALSRAGFRPVVYDNLSTGHRWAVRWGPFEAGELADTAHLIRVMRRHDVQAVIHFAASSVVAESMQRPGLYYRNNVAGTLSLLEAMATAKIDSIVWSSTAAVYGEPETVPIPEDHPRRPINPYGETKKAVEQMLHWWQQAAAVNAMSLRYFNAAGADIEGEIGEAHAPETHLIPIAIEAAQGLRPALSLYGEDYPTPDGTALRDYVHVSDLADAHVRAVRHLLGGKPGMALNLGTGTGQSVRQVIGAVESVSGAPLPVRTAPRRPGDPPILVADPAKAFDILKWKPVLSDLKTIVESAWRWHSSNVHGHYQQTSIRNIG